MPSDFVADDVPDDADAIDIRELRRRAEVDEPSSPVARFDEPLKLDAGQSLNPWQIAYQTYGELNAARTNAVLICHALTGDQHAANRHPVTGRPGWWDAMVGPGRPVDTDRFFVICTFSIRLNFL